MKKHNKVIWILSGIVVILIAVLLFVLGNNSQSQTRQNSKAVTKTTRVSRKVTSPAQENSSTSSASSSSSQPRKEELSYKELAVAAYINTLRGDSVAEKMVTFDECANGQSNNPSTEKPTSFEQHNDPTFQINEGDMGFAWDVISFNEDSIDIEHFTHGEQDGDKSFTKLDIEEQYGSYKDQLDVAIQKINQNQQDIQDSQDDDSDEE